MAGRDAELEAGIDAALAGTAHWCRLCDRLRYEGDMRWLFDVFGCRWCLPEARQRALWVDPWAKKLALVKAEALDLRKKEAEAREMIIAYGF
ncbi:hypothetical protein I5G61_gp78 [Mycobacterium phage Quesadilla]|uniref:Uncharacterized protein n=1 Tax=Mycobacterium phage Quesadilla TaxID=2664226 RepID=A0A5Q2W9Z8_9CAUD|nr:hypothetical protein I5G61_gp78 [Mycobacterium phage Quesadilla]QGH75326.1 hypothetical protein SEA_QUESADILLA_78 [Mycobacterium phage Quesadilla]